MGKILSIVWIMMMILVVVVIVGEVKLREECNRICIFYCKFYVIGKECFDCYKKCF